MVRDMYQDTELVDGQFDPILGLCHIAYHFIPTSGTSPVNAWAKLTILATKGSNPGPAV
jgi:hypothetical protein